MRPAECTKETTDLWQSKLRDAARRPFTTLFHKQLWQSKEFPQQLSLSKHSEAVKAAVPFLLVGKG